MRAPTQDWRNQHDGSAASEASRMRPRILITEPIAQEGIDLLRYELPERAHRCTARSLA